MLSILIPVYNYSINSLLTSLNKAVESLDCTYEILCLEDGSKSYLDDNKVACISTKNTAHIISDENIGSVASRKLLAQKAKYDWLLFLDADVKLIDNSLIHNYLNCFKSTYDAIYGGCSYDSVRPNDENILRWKYGSVYEQVNAKSRNKNPFKHLVSANFFIKKSIFLEVSSEIKSKSYGNDLLFASIMKSNNVKVLHIDNFVIHQGLDSNEKFLQKVKQAVYNLYKHYQSNTIEPYENSLLKTFKKAEKLYLNRLIALLFHLTESPIKKHLLGSNPSIKLLQFYKLGYLCSLSLKKK